MSQTSNEAGDTTNSSKNAYVELSRMLREGRSWSGRERNCAFLNTRDGRFANIAATSGFDFPDDARAVALVDWDQDGDQDLWVSNRNEPRIRLLLNQTHGGSSVAFRLVGNGTTTNADAVGARVEIETAGANSSRQIRTLRAGEGYLAQSSQWVHFGLGAARDVARIRVRWPAGVVEEFGGAPTPGRYRLVQGSGRAEALPRRSDTGRIQPSSPSRPPESSAARVPLQALLRVPEGLTYEMWSGGGKPTIPVVPGKALLVNLFASWCSPCALELSELTRAAASLRAAGLDVLALSVDGLGDDRGDPARAEELLTRIKFPFSSGRATRASVTALQRLNDTHVALHRPLPVPTSFLIDSTGKLSVIYKGPATVHQILEDVQRSPGSRRERSLRAAPMGGLAIDHPVVEEALKTSEASLRFLFALNLEGAGHAEAARREYEEVASLKPDLPGVHNTLGLMAARVGKIQEARALFRQEIVVNPGLAEGHNNLGLTFLNEGLIRDALPCFDEALRLDPNHADAHNNRGIILKRMGRVLEAVGEYQLAIQASPKFVEARNNLGLAYLSLGRNDEARAQFVRALELDPAFHPAKLNLEKLQAAKK